MAAQQWMVIPPSIPFRFLMLLIIVLLVCLSQLKATFSFVLNVDLKQKPVTFSEVVHHSMVNNNNNNSNNNNNNDDGSDDGFRPLDPESLVATKCLIEQTLCQPIIVTTGEDGPNNQRQKQQPRLAKDFDYASAILDAWKQEEANSEQLWMVEWKSITYQDSQGTPLYGHIIRRRRTTSASEPTNNNNGLPGILLFHTGAGPHDIFLLWKAAALVSTLGDGNDDDNNDNDGCVVFITDILSDEYGWAWDPDRTRYEAAKLQLFASAPDGHGHYYRPVLQDRIRAAMRALTTVQQTAQLSVDPNRLAALGWCLGGQSILELGRMKVPGMKVMVTFHGVFDDPKPRPETDTVTKDPNVAAAETAGGAVATTGSEILICHGMRDPFVSSDSLEQALELFQNHGHLVSLLQLKDAKHGFSNPAQDYNDNPAFAYHDESASKAWKQALALLQRRCFASK